VEGFQQASALRDLLGKLEQDAKMLRSDVAARIHRDDSINLSAVARRIGLTPQRLSQLAREARPRSAPPTSEATMTAEAQPIVAAIVTSDQGLLVTYRHDKTPPAGFLTGEIEPGESAADAMVRECKEEAGLRVAAGSEIGRRIHPKTGRTMIYVAGTPVEDSEVFVGDREELTDVRWVTLAEADAAFAPFGGMFKPVHDYLLRNLPA
jgi:8-oxo-dGTP pyrophosphatase MutT (NUDIX family)